MAKKKPSVAVDFDGVIHQYTSKWTTATEIKDPPVPGAFSWLKRTSRDFNIIIWTSRLTCDEDTEAGWARVIDAEKAIREWFVAHGFDAELLATFEFWNAPGKPHALIYIDDRGFRFEGKFPHKGQIFKRPYKTPAEETIQGDAGVPWEPLNQVRPEELPKEADDRFPDPWRTVSRGNGHIDVYDRSGRAFAHVYTWDMKDNKILEARMEGSYSRASKEAEQLRSRQDLLAKIENDPEFALFTIQRLRAERSRLRKEVVENRASTPHEWEADFSGRIDLTQNLTWTCKHCGETTCAPVDPYFDPEGCSGATS